MVAVAAAATHATRREEVFAAAAAVAEVDGANAYRRYRAIFPK